MATWTLFGQPATPAPVVSDHTGTTDGVQFQTSSPGTLTAIWFFSPAGAGALPGTIALFSVSGGGSGTLIHSEAASWSSGASAGWVRAAFSSPPSLAASTAYKAAVFFIGGTDWYSATNHYWDTGPGSGGITSGPLTAPSNAGGDGGQDTFDASGVLAYPASSFLATNYWVDPEVMAAPPPSTAVATSGATIGLGII